MISNVLKFFDTIDRLRETKKIDEETAKFLIEQYRLALKEMGMPQK